MVTLEVADDGAGVAADHRTAIFERSARDGERVRRWRNWFGRAITREIITAHRGHIWIEHAEAGGPFVVTFRVA